jgi:hypothetical protein
VTAHHGSRSPLSDASANGAAAANRPLPSADSARVRYSAAVDQPIPILMATDSTVKHKVPPKVKSREVV